VAEEAKAGAEVSCNNKDTEDIKSIKINSSNNSADSRCNATSNAVSFTSNNISYYIASTTSISRDERRHSEPWGGPWRIIIDARRN
jgi:hypothetical protein